MNGNTAVFSFQYRRLADEQPVCKLAAERPNLSVYAADGAMISGIAGQWHSGEMPKNWEDIRPTFWGLRDEAPAPVFLLGDFSQFARFCALAQATDISRADTPIDPNQTTNPSATGDSK